MKEQQVTVGIRGDVGGSAVRYARRKVSHVTARLDAPVLSARVKLLAASDRARERPALAQAVLDVDGEIIRAHVAGHDMKEAIDLLGARLQGQLEMRTDRRSARRRQGPAAGGPGGSRHGDEPAHRPRHFPRPVGECEVVRRKSYVLHVLSPAEADEELLRMDYDFHMFTDALTAEDSVVYRRPEGGVELRSLSEPIPAPELTENEAVQRLGLTSEPFLFYRDTATGRGAVAYRRYDGHYGVIVASAPAAADRSLTVGARLAPVS